MFYRNTGLPIHLGIICGCFCDMKAEWRAVSQITWPKKSEVFTIWEMTKQLVGYTSTPLWHVGALCWLHPFTELNPQICAPMIFFYGFLVDPGAVCPCSAPLCIIAFHRLHCRWLPAAWVWLWWEIERQRKGTANGFALPLGVFLAELRLLRVSAPAGIPVPCPCAILTSPASPDPPA